MQLLLGVAAVLIGSLPLWSWSSAVGWHDSQRIGQILVIAGTACVAALQGFQSRQPLMLGERTRISIFLLAAGGVVSALLARQPVWALAEMAIALGSLGLAWVLVVARQRATDGVDRILMGTVFFVCTALCLQFLVAYVAAMTSGIGRIDPWLLIRGFDNLRFFGQFSTLTLPLLAVPLLAQGPWHRYRVVATVVLLMWWALAIASGTRGTWLGMAVAGCWLVCAGAGGRWWVRVQVAAAVAGVLVFQLLMAWFPALMGLEVANHAGDRLTTSLSGREGIWRQALDMMVQKPWLGFGPMHFADIANPVAAHPHQAWLQWASEWGIPSAILLTWLVARAACVVFRRIQVQAGTRDLYSVLHTCLAASVAASLAQSMVDGVLVMPYTQIWLAICGGWLFSVHQQIEIGAAAPQTVAAPWVWRGVWGLSLVLAAGVLLGILFRDARQLDVRELQYAQELGGHFQPRFWAQGVIAGPTRAPTHVQGAPGS